MAPNRRRRFYLIFSCFIILVLGFKSLTGSHSEDGPRRIVVGAKSFVESQILGELIATLLEANTDLEVERRWYLGDTRQTFNALWTGHIDVCAEYDLSAIVQVLELPIVSSPRMTWQTVEKRYKSNFNLIWLKPLGFSNKIALMLRKADAEKHGIRTMSDLASFVNSNPGIQPAYTPNFVERAEFERLISVYRVPFEKEPLLLDNSLLFSSLARGYCDVIAGHTTDGRVLKYDVIALEDDQNALPPSLAAPVIRKSMLKSHPKLTEVINRLAGQVSANAIREMNYQVLFEGKDPRDLAAGFLIKKGLVRRENLR